MTEFRRIREDHAEYIKGLNSAGLTLDSEADFTIGLFEHGTLLGAFSIYRNIIKRIFVNEEFRGQGYMAQMMTQAVKELVRNGESSYFVFTRPCNQEILNSLGFRTLAATSGAILLEGGTGGIEDYLKNIRKQLDQLRYRTLGSVVVNCNPMTLGHLYLIREASRNSDALIIFVVEEDRSTFPFADRVKIIREAVSDLENLVVAGTGRYIVSSATFPSYFTAEEEVAGTQAELDAVLFAERIAGSLGIAVRTVGEEPYCAVTSKYNAAMEKVFKKSNLDFRIIRRKIEGNDPISASKVRRLLMEGELEAAFSLVPEATRRYLGSPEGRKIIEYMQKNRVSGKRH